ncbi:MAG: hypothetical protein SVZ03_05185 [Spirochaetota bacterium]|nr:hypothetical protein [Spirochaetota bacterium]
MTHIDGHPLFNINSDSPHYSTGRSFVEWPEYWDGSLSAGGLPNGSLKLDFSNTDEIFFVYYQKYDDDWPEESGTNTDHDYRPPDDKLWTVYHDNGYRTFGNWVVDFVGVRKSNGNNPVNHEMYNSYGFSLGDECPTCVFYNPGSNYISSYTTRTTTEGVDHVEWDSRGKWMEYKVHLKMKTWAGETAKANGIAEVWINGTKITDDSMEVNKNIQTWLFEGNRAIAYHVLKTVCRACG